MFECDFDHFMYIDVYDDLLCSIFFILSKFNHSKCIMSFQERS
jgi:hypothetical protein